MNLPLLICASLLILTGCKQEAMKIQSSALKDLPPASRELLAGRKIFFAHQSVGFDIMQGVQDLLEENNLTGLNIVETNDPGDFKGPVFAHALSGNNQDPQSKIDAFLKLMDSGLGNVVDIAFFKFCYVDITASTDIDEIFTNYRNTMAGLQNKYPDVTFIHFTTPLTALQSWMRGLVKRLIGKPIGMEDNLKREQFNKKLREAYRDQGTLFDLAKAEATSPAGDSASFTTNGKTCLQLNPDYTYDGGHLNHTGRKHVAEQLLLHLVRVSEIFPPRPLP